MKKKIIDFYYLLGNSKNKYYKSIFLYSLSSLIDILVLSLLPFLISALLGKNLNFNLINYQFQFDSNNGILFIGIAILLLTFLKSYCNFNSIFRAVKLSNELQKNNRNKIFTFYRDIFINDISKNKLEQYLNYTAYVVGVFSENIVFKSITVISEILIIFIICIYLSFLNVFVLSGLLIFFLLFLIGYFFIIKDKIYDAGTKQAQAMQKLVEIINDVFKGFKEIKVLKLDKYFDKKFHSYNEEYNKYFINYQKLIFVPKYMLEVIMITFIILLFFSFSYIAEKPLNNYFELMGVFLFASLRITPLAYNIFSSLSQIFSSWYAVTELANEFNIIEQAKNKTVKFNQNSNLVNLSSIKKISLNNISFNYGLNSKKILNDINLEIHKGTCIGIKGASGSGKTTLINIILGLLKPSNGEIMVNENFQYFQTNIQDRMSYTPQDIFLVKGSILDNIALGQSKTDIDKENLYYSTMNSQILQFIEGKDVSKDIMQILDNYNVENLSGGQAQRIAIARNLYFKKDINVFDEFTSALDAKIEDKIVSHLHKIKENKIIIIVSHRMNAMKHCDIIYELKEGKLEKM